METLYLSLPDRRGLVIDDPDDGYYMDARLHLAFYQIVDSDMAALNKWSLGKKWTPPQSPTIEDLIREIEESIKAHNAKVADFSKWENAEFRVMASEASIGINFAPNQGTGAPNMGINPMSVLAYMEGLTQAAGNWVIKTEQYSPSSDSWLMNAYDEKAHGGAGQQYGITWTSLENCKKVKAAIERLVPERNRRIEPLRDEIRQIYRLSEVLTRNLLIVMKDIDNGTVRGRCKFEQQLRQEKKENRFLSQEPRAVESNCIWNQSDKDRKSKDSLQDI